MGNGDATLPLPSAGLDIARHPPDPVVIDSHEQAWQRLISGTIPRDELPSLIEGIFSGRKTDMVDRLGGRDAQAFIDIMDEVRHHSLFQSNSQFTSHSASSH